MNLVSELAAVRERIYEVYKRSPEEALERSYEEYKKYCPWESDRLWCSQSLLGLDGVTRYSSFKVVTKQELVGRKYKIEFWDGRVSIFWLDVQHNPRTFKSEPYTEE